MRVDKVEVILSVITLLVGMSIIYFTPNGKNNGYWIIPLIIFWTIRYIRRKSKEKHENCNKEEM